MTTVSQEAREAAAECAVLTEYRDLIREGRCDDGSLVQAFHKFEQSIRQSAERGEAEPVAYLYTRDDGSKDLVLDCNGEYARNLIEHGATEVPLYALPIPPEAGS